MSNLTAFEHLYLQDSYFLGLTVSGRNLQLRALFALTRDHPLYRQPTPGEQHCYREGIVSISAPRILDLRGAATPPILSDPDGTLDLGSIDVVSEDGGVRIITEWFEAHIEAADLRVELDSSSPRP